MSTFIFRIWCNCCIFPSRWCIDVISWTNKSRLVHNWSYWHLFESLKNETKLQRRKPRPSFFNNCWIRFGNCSPKVIYLFKATHSMGRLRQTAIFFKVRCTCNLTSKDWNSTSFLPLPQNLDRNTNSIHIQILLLTLTM